MGATAFANLGFAVVSGPISFFLCKKILMQALDQMETDAITIIQKIHEVIVNKKKQSLQSN